MTHPRISIKDKRDIILKSKTTCFVSIKIALIIVKDAFSDSKTSCFTMSDGSDRYLKSITLYNGLILNGLKRKVIDSWKKTFKKINRGKGNLFASIFKFPQGLNSIVWFQEWNSVTLPIAAWSDVITINVIIGRSRSTAITGICCWRTDVATILVVVGALLSICCDCEYDSHQCHH